MRRFLPGILLVLMLTAFAVSIVGCHGMGETAAERSDDHSRQLRLNGTMMIDDVDSIFQQDRPSRLSEYTIR
ncbi:MAG: hypothetical protein WC496_10565 [Phycisphaerae bacterium]